MARTGGVAAFGLALIVLSAAFGAAAQTPGEIQDPSSYRGSMELQRQEQAQAAQQAQQNAQAQQRLDQAYAGNNPQRAGGGGRGGPPPVDWWSKPPLDPAHNPLLGRWKQSGPPKAPQLGVAGLLPGASEFVGGAFAGGCDSIFGKGTTAFEPNALMWVAPDGHEEILNHVAYRANGNDIIVLTRDPGAIPALIFALPNHDHAVVAFLGCALARQGVRPASAPVAGASVPGAPRPGPAQSSVQAVMSFLVASAAPEPVAPMAGGKIWVSRDPPEVGLQAFGIPAAPGGGADRLAIDCADQATCRRDLEAMTKGALGVATADAVGHAQTPPLPPGRYYLLGLAPSNGRIFAWSMAVVLPPGGTTVALSQLNARRLK